MFFFAFVGHGVQKDSTLHAVLPLMPETKFVETKQAAAMLEEESPVKECDMYQLYPIEQEIVKLSELTPVISFFNCNRAMYGGEEIPY